MEQSTSTGKNTSPLIDATALSHDSAARWLSMLETARKMDAYPQYHDDQELVLNSNTGMLRYSMAEYEASQNFLSAFDDQISNLAKSRGLSFMAARYVVQEIGKNIYDHGGDPKECFISWDLGSIDPHIEVSNRFSPLFYPAKYFDDTLEDHIAKLNAEWELSPQKSGPRPMWEGNQRPSEEQIEHCNNHFGMRILAGFSGRLSYLWIRPDQSQIFFECTRNEASYNYQTFRREGNQGPAETFDLRVLPSDLERDSILIVRGRVPFESNDGK